ncbi:bifunctional DNA primase/polymerase [Nonomuraea sp. NPDC003754]
MLDSRCRWKPSPSAPGATHLYHAAPDRLTLGNVQGARGGLGWLIDTRAAGEYVVGPGSFVDPSWPNQMEIFFSVVQRKVVTPNDSTSLDQVEYGPIAFERRSTRPPDPSDGSSLRPTSRT